MAQIVKVHSRPKLIIPTLSFESWCLRVEVPLIAHIMTHLFTWFDCVLTRSWNLFLLQFFTFSKSIRRRVETRAYRFCRDDRLNIIPRTWKEFSLFLNWLLLLPDKDTLCTQASGNVVRSRVWSLHLWGFNFLHLVIIILFKAQIIDWNGWNMRLIRQC
jgi:hypothetical protein